jgi:type IV secretion system protein VirD4
MPLGPRLRAARVVQDHGLVIPAILEWQGNLVTTSIKPDVLRATCAHRANLGAVWVYDPLALAGVPGASWTPLAHCHTYADARRIGRMLADAAEVHGHRAEDANYWQLLGAKLLSVLLFAAAGTGRGMADVARWVDIQDVDDVAQALMEIGNQQALDAWAACTSRPDNTMGSVYGTAETLLDVFGDPQIAASADGCDLDIDELLTGANNTLYLYAPASEQERLRPLFELLVSVVIYKAEELAAAQPDGMLDPRLFVCLDEAGNCAAIKKLPQLATRGRGQGIQPLTIWHDEAQLQHRYGQRASTVLNGHRAKLLLNGQADPASLELASKLVGDEAVTQTSETTGGDGRASLTESTAYRRLLPPEALRQLKPRRALLVYGHLPPVRIRLRPWFRSRHLVTLAMAVDAAVPSHGRRRPGHRRSAAADRRGRGRRLMQPLQHPEGNGTRPASPARRPATPAPGPPRPAAGGVSRLDRVTLQLGVAVACVIAVCSLSVAGFPGQ